MERLGRRTRQLRKSKPGTKSGKQASRSLRLEPLETRVALSADGLVPIGEQPTGPLTGKIVYTSGGHGWQWSTTLGRYATDRGETQEMVEDFGNQDQLTFYADYLLRAGATVVPLRPVGHQVNEVVLDNDSAGVTFSGGWSNSTGARHYDEDYGAVADVVSYRFADTAATESAVATYTPTIPQAGFYPIYTWVAHGSNRTLQTYKINHTGGQTQVNVDHSKVGNGWVYLGTYYFAAGSSVDAGSVQISNEGATGKVVIADAIRFGNGMGDVKNGSNGVGDARGQISGYPREDENSLLWLWRAVGQGVSSPSSIIGTSNVTAPGKMAEHMNVDTNPFGTSVYVGFHSNAFDGSARGSVGLVSSSNPTTNQSALSTYIARQVQTDMQTRAGDFEYGWASRGYTLTGAYGEINASNFSNARGLEMDATLFEVAFHDNLQDASLLRDPRAREQIGRSAYEGTLEYFVNHGGVATNVAIASKPSNVSAVSNVSGEVTVKWSAGPTGVYGAAATGYRIYASVDGYGFDGGTYVAGGATSTATLSGYDPTIPYYFKVVAVNAGGESLATEVISVLPSGGEKQILIVNGFDRYDRLQNARYAYAGGTVDRVWARYNNSFDYVVQVSSAIHTSSPGVHFASASNEAVISGAINLADYDAVVWVLGNESTANDTFNAAEQTKVESFIAGGGHLFVTGSEIAFDLDQSNNGRTFFENTLQGNYVADDANTYNVIAPAGGIFAGLSFSFDNGAQFYNVTAPDVISPQAGAIQALTYSGGTGGSAGIQFAGTGGRGNVVVFGFPFETISTAANRVAVMDRVLDFFGVAAPAPTGDFTGDGVVDGADFLAWQRGFGAASPVLADGDADRNGIVDGADLNIWSEQFGSSVPAAAAVGGATVAALQAQEEVAMEFAVDAVSELAWLAQRPLMLTTSPGGSRHDFALLRKQAHAQATNPKWLAADDQRPSSRWTNELLAVIASHEFVDLTLLDQMLAEESFGGDWQTWQH
jgi:hypothetical protein